MQKRFRQLFTASEKAGLSKGQALQLFASVLQQEREDALEIATTKIRHRFHTESIAIERLLESDYQPATNGVVQVY